MAHGPERGETKQSMNDAPRNMQVLAHDDAGRERRVLQIQEGHRNVPPPLGTAVAHPRQEPVMHVH